MVNGATTQATEMINNQDDKDAVSMSLGNSGIDANVKSTAERDTSGYQHDTGQGTPYATNKDDKGDYEPLPKDDTTNYEQKEYEISQEIDNLQEFYESIEYITSFNELFDRLSDEQFNEITGYTKNQWREIYNDNLLNKTIKEKNQMFKTLKNGVKQVIGNQLSELRDTKDSYFDKWDRRTDQQKRDDQLLEEQRQRDDTAYQRASDDLSKAGYNPNYLKGVNYGGGGGGGGLGSKADDEEEKRKRRKRELEAERQAQKQKRQDNMRMLMSVLGTMGGIGGSLGAAAIRNVGLKEMAETRASGYIDSQELRNMNAIELQKMRQSGNMRLQNKRHEHNQERDNMRYLFRNKEVNDRNYQNIQRDKRRRYGYYDDIDLDETYMQQHNRKKYGR